MEKHIKIAMISAIVLIGFVVSIFYHYIMGAYLNFGFPIDTFASFPGTQFSDFTKTVELIGDLKPLVTPNYWMNYFPLTYVLLYPLVFCKHLTWIYFFLLSIFIGVFGGLNWKMLYSNKVSKVENFQNIFIISFLSYPFLYLIDRGNIDMWLFFLLIGAVYYFKEKKYFKSALIFGLLNGIKPFFLLFLLLFFKSKKYKEAFLSIFISLFCILLGFALLKENPFDACSVFIQNQVLFNRYCIETYYGFLNNSSIFMNMKLFMNVLLAKPLMSSMDLFFIYKYVLVSFVAILSFLFWIEKTYWKQITILSLAMCMLPIVSADYKFIFLFIPMWLFINSKEKSKFDWIYTLLFSLLLIPKQVIIIFLKDGVRASFSVSLFLSLLLMFVFIIIFFIEIVVKKRIEK